MGDNRINSIQAELVDHIGSLFDIDNLPNRLRVNFFEFPESLPDYHIGTVDDEDGVANVRLDVYSIDGILINSGIKDEELTNGREYIALSMYAGYLLTNGLLRDLNSGNNVRKAMTDTLPDSENIKKVVKELAWGKLCSPDVVDSFFDRLAEDNPEEILTINAQRIGAGVLLNTLDCSDQPIYVSVLERLQDSIYDNWRKRIELDAGLIYTFNGNFEKAASIVAESSLKVKGLGYAFPAGKVELESLRKKVIEARALDEVEDRVCSSAQVIEVLDDQVFTDDCDGYIVHDESSL